MALEFQNVDVVFTEGLDTKNQQKLVVPGKWESLLNYTLSKEGSLSRRDGIANFSSQNGNGLATHNDELLLVNGTSLHSVSTAGAALFQRSGQLGYVKVAKEEIVRTTGMQDTPDCAYGNGFTCYVWLDADSIATPVGINVTLVDESTGTQVISNQQINAGGAAVFCPRVVFADDAFFIFYVDLPDIFCRVIETSSPSVIGAQTSVLNDANLAARNIDCCAQGDGVTFYGPGVFVAHGYADGVTSVMGLFVTRSGATPSAAYTLAPLVTEVQLPINNLQALATVAYSTAEVGVFTRGLNTGAPAMSGTAGVVVDDVGTLSAGPTQLDATAGVTTAPIPVHLAGVLSGSSVQLFYDQANAWGTGGTTLFALRTVSANSALVVTTAASTLLNSVTSGGVGNPRAPQGPWIAGKPFVQAGSNVILPVMMQEQYQNFAATTLTFNRQNVVFFVDGFSGVVVGKALYGSLGLPRVNNNPPIVSTPCSTPEVSTGVFALTCMERTQAVFAGGFNISPTGLVRLTLTPNTRDTLSADKSPPIRDQLGESTFFAGGQLCSYDGLRVTEHGFPLFPEGIDITVAAGGALAVGTYQGVAVYEWVDNSGQRFQSAPSPPVSFTTTGGNQTINVDIPTLLLSQKPSIRIALYFTQPGGTIFNRYATLATGDGSVANDTTVAFVTVTINASIATITSNEALYTQPGSGGTPLEVIAPPPCNAFTKHQNRLFLDVADEPFTYQFSQPYTNNLGIEFNPALRGRIDSSSGGIIGFASLDEKLIIFGRDKLFVVYGTGPGLSGSNSNYSDPQEIQSDVGCTEARSILKIPSGVIFKSAKGFYLLGRDLSVNYIGAGVARYDSDGIVAAVMHEKKQEARFYSNTSGRVFVYCYLLDQWSLFAYGTGSAYQPNDAIFWNTSGEVWSVSRTEGLNYDTSGVFVDDPGARAATTIVGHGRTAFLKIQSIGGFQRAQWLYVTASPTAGVGDSGTLVVSVFLDDSYSLTSPSYAASYPWSGTVSNLDLRHKLRAQKCKSVAFSFSDTPTAGGLNLQALTLRVGLKKGTNKLPAAKTLP